MTNTSVVCISSQKGVQAVSTWQKLCQELSANYTKLSNIQEFFTIISDPDFHVDFLSLDLEDLQQLVPKISMQDLVNTIKVMTALYPTVDDLGNKVRRDVSIIATVGSNTPNDLLREFLQVPTVKGLMPRRDDYSYEQIKTAMIALSSRQYYIPDDVAKRLHMPAQQTMTKVKLSTRQQQILDIIVHRGVSNKVIASMLNISESTVKLHLSSIFRRFGVRNRTQLAVFLRSQCN